jgi:hypothetical protein
VVDLIINKEVGLIINTPWGKGAHSDGFDIRTAAATHGIPCVTTMAAASALVQGLKAVRHGGIGVKALQDYYAPAGSHGGADGVSSARLPSISPYPAPAPELPVEL